jgi:hypothetical protein
MSNTKAFRSMSDLIDGLKRAEAGLRGGSLSLEALDSASADARELYERLIVLRHKAREHTLGKPAQEAKPAVAEKKQAAPPPSANATSEPVIVEAKPSAPVSAAPKPEAPAAPATPTPIRLNIRPSEQREAEEAMAEAEPSVMKTAAEYLKEAQASKGVTAQPSAIKMAESVAEKLERAKITDLAKAITLSDKFWFIKELFGGDAKAYEVGVSLLNSAKDHAEAKSFLNEELLTKLKNPPDAEALEAFSELIERRFA